ncbi:MAG: hypothetical protein JXR35_02815 [Rhodobacteraceae bacterium]|nr:hypothetical protein [Paracoccaceae bacterium]
MFALFLAVTIALALLVWGEFAPRLTGTLAQAQEVREVAQGNGRGDAAKPARRKVALPRFTLPRFNLRLFKRADKSERQETLSSLSAPVVPLDELREQGLEAAAPTARPTTSVPSDADAEVMARIEAMLEAPKTPLNATDDLPSIPDFAPGDQIALEFEGPAPHVNDIRFEADPTQRHAIALIANEPILLIENTDPATLSPAILSFRAHAT